MNDRWRRVQWGASRGGIVGLALSALLLVIFAVQVWSGDTPRTAGLGVGMLSWLASVPAGLLLLVPAIRTIEALGFQESIARNMAVILAFGVCGNCIILGAIYGLLRKARSTVTTPAT